MNLINVIQDIGPLTSRKRSREGHCDDSLIVTMPIDQYVSKHILVSAGSSTNILFKETFKQMDMTWSKVIPYAASLVGFTGKTIKF